MLASILRVPNPCRALVAAALFALLVVSTAAAAPPGSLQRIDLPANVLATAADAQAYRAVGPEGEAWLAEILLDDLRAGTGPFETLLVQRTSLDGYVDVDRVEVPPCGKPLALEAVSGDVFVLFAEIGGLTRNNYDLLCEIDEMLPTRQLIPRICTMIYCTGEVFRAGELGELVDAELPVSDPEMLVGRPGAFGPVGPGDPWPGGLDGGNVCDVCLDPKPGRTTMGSSRCSGRPTPIEVPKLPEGDVVYAHRSESGPAAGRSQIYRMGSSGASPVNLSNSQFSDGTPDVEHGDGRIAFSSSRGSDWLHIMQGDGSGVVAIPGTELASRPRWSNLPWGEPFVVFTRGIGSPNASIWRVGLDGSGARQITFPADNESDELADVYDLKYVVFSRYLRDEGQRDLFLQYMHDDRPPVRLTDTPDISETLPVVSRDNSRIAYAVRPHGARADRVVIAKLSQGSLVVTRSVSLASPSADVNLSGIDFWPGGDGLYVSIQVDDVASPLLHRRQEVFAVDFAGNQWRLTSNSDLDVYPSAAP
ncbi:MAG: hypothetical protein AAGC60_21725 [Acidobacteriota bacterium]